MLIDRAIKSSNIIKVANGTISIILFLLTIKTLKVLIEPEIKINKTIVLIIHLNHVFSVCDYNLFFCPRKKRFLE